MFARFALLLCLSLLISIRVYADVFHLRNGDRISGRLLKRTDDSLVIESPILGELRIPLDELEEPEKKLSDRAMSFDSAKDRNIDWQRKLSLGYRMRTGNTKANSLSVELFLNRKTSYNEFTGKFNYYYSSQSSAMDDRKIYSMLRYAYSFGDELNWYHFFKIEQEHDYFSDIKYRMIPSSGIGYWFSDKAPFKAMIEASLGYEYSNFYSQKNSGELIAVGRAFFEYSITKTATLMEDISFYPNLDDLDFRLRSETKLSLAIVDGLSIVLSLVDEFNSEPATDKARNDAMLITSLEWSF